jgi:hypothetical protein
VTMQDVTAAYDTTAWSATPFDTVVNQTANAPLVVAGTGNEVAAGVGRSFNFGASGNEGFVFAAGPGQNTMTAFHQAAANTPDLFNEPGADHLDQIFGARSLVPSNDTGANAGIHPDPAIDAAAWYATHMASLAANHFHF